ncbi:alkylphosphonate utilization protein [Halomonas sp. ML-15]|uniref:zinc ribbon domain-containing protein YjdM n=1 Tax=Halomonas sp. ML-15 TaxID=2773305 RepID=UPI001745E804|nr:zinc ribbon domain-containing protein YjdM [Halomonas sp. ML-15]MBD3896289.1 alkylphosphonate utilization protein [Halomonas sp. ML-15]
MSELPNCPACASEFTYHDGIQYVCPECGHEWAPGEEAADSGEDVLEARDANGNLLADGDSVTVIKDLKVKGSSSVIKVGTKVKSVRLIEGDAEGGHNLDCKVEGIGPIKLTSAFVKKA